MYTNLPIFKQAMDLNVYIEDAVRAFSRFNKYGIGSELREKARVVLYAIYKIYFSKNKIESILELRDTIEELKITIYLAKELKSLRDFRQFELLSQMVRELAKQAQGWLNSQKPYPQKG
ncbi:MAG TPA: four helix bundle protein [Campylobacterales bacterium]|nr:four helix bundle protein [Campylobacterales bacterium]